MKKIALLGKGKTGGRVIELAKENITVFDSSNPPTFETLQNHDVIISFLPGTPFLEYIPLLIDCKIPVITGSTGFDWPDDIDQTLRNEKLTWIKASNFSLGMALIKGMLAVVGKSDSLFED